MAMRTRLAALTAALVLVPTVAGASSSILSVPDGALSLEDLAPGSVRASTVTLTNPSDLPAEVTFAVVVTSDEENGCLRQELDGGDTTCDADGGELGRWLDVSLAQEGTDLWSGPMLDLEEPVLLTDELPAGESFDLDLEVTMLGEAGNDTMTDRIAFDLVVSMRTATDEVDTEVLGVEATAGGGTGPEVAGVSAVAGVPTVVAAGLERIGLGHVTPGQAGAGSLGLLAAALGLVLVLRARRRQRAY